MLARTPEECLLPSLDKPSLEGLSYLLRHPEKWPLGFKWEYDKCTSCAMGLAHRLWRVFSSNTQIMLGTFGTGAAMAAVHDTAIALGMPQHIAMDIFGQLHETVDASADVTPIMVADAIDAYLARRG